MDGWFVAIRSAYLLYKAEVNGWTDLFSVVSGSFAEGIAGGNLARGMLKLWTSVTGQTESDCRDADSGLFCVFVVEAGRARNIF